MNSRALVLKVVAPDREALEGARGQRGRDGDKALVCELVAAEVQQLGARVVEHVHMRQVLSSRCDQLYFGACKL